MKLLAPVKDLESAILQINAGANEIYLGGDTEAFNNFSFSGRGKYSPIVGKICPTSQELDEIVCYAHNHKVTVMYTANLPFLAEDSNCKNSYIKHFIQYIENGLKAEVDSIVVGDLGALLLLNKMGINTKIAASTFFETTTKEQVLFFKELGVSRVVLSYQVTMPEIKEFCKIPDVEIEVFGHYGCSFYDGYCNFKHFFGESKDSKIGIPCRNSYKFFSGDTQVYEGDILNSSLICSICSLVTLEKLGVYALKLVGRGNIAAQNAEITSVYSKMLQYIHESDSALSQYKNTILPRWWKQSLCKKQLCKYKDNKITSSFTGLSS